MFRREMQHGQNSASSGHRPNALRPVAAIESTVLNGFTQMLRLDRFRTLQIGNRARHFEDAVVRPRR
jgi:hypothetical protein